MPGESTFSAQITNLVGGATIDEEFCDDAAQDACKEIINQLPANLKAKCSTITIRNATNGTTLDMDGKGDILSVTRLSANSGGYYKPCREIPAMYGDLSNDSTDLNYYATASDPVYWITSNSSGVSTLFIKPTPTDAQPANVYHIAYPSVDVSASTVEIANFPDEATYLVVLFAATRQLMKFQATMSASFNSDITTAFSQAKQSLANAGTEIGLANQEVDDALTEIEEAISLTDSSSSDIKTAVDGMKTAVAKFRADGSDPALFGDESTYHTSNSAITKVKEAVDDAKSLIGLSTEGDKYHANYDLEANMADIDAELSSATTQIAAEDTELGSAYIQSASARIQQAQAQMNAMASHLSLAQMHITEWNTTVQTLVSEINAFASEAGSRYGGINAKAVVWQGELSAAQGYLANVSAYISQSNGFIAEAGARLQADTAKYQWYGDQYAKLSAEYTRGLAALKGA